MKENTVTNAHKHSDYPSSKQILPHSGKALESHSHSHSHHHVDMQDTSGSRLLMTLGLNFMIPIAQVIGGVLANSVALISDSTHNFSIAFSCHMEVADQPVSRTEEIGEKVRHDLWHKFGIDHPVLQFETVQCGNGGILCEISCGTQKNGL